MSSGLAVDLRLDVEGPVVGTEPVRPADLRDALAELWWNAHARHGDFACDEHEMRIAIGCQRRGATFTLRTTGPAGHTELRLPCQTLENAARRGIRMLLELGIAEHGELVHFAARRTSPWLEVARDPRIIGEQRDLRIARGSLRTVLACAEPRDEAAATAHELFYTETALRDAERIARRGEDLQPVIETGGVLVGFVAYCAEAEDAFVVVTDAIETAGAEHGESSLTFTAETWQRIDQAIGALRDRRGNPALRVLGQVHGHPFSPTDDCGTCDQRPHCQQHSAYLSDDDRRWSRAVFAGQPWQVGHLFGLDPRGAPTATVFGLRRGRLEPRGYRVLHQRDLARCEFTT